MRPRFLKLEGLQSFMEVQEVDFDRLGEMGLFGIFGPTGSGKSTILDAITLALYGNVQRANRGTQGIINTTMSDMKVSFTFDLVKERNRKTYRVERVYKRKKDSDTSVESKLARIFEVVGNQEQIIADKLSDVNTYIIELVGLQFDDFTRSVVLPQNKFQEFLLSPKAEKTKMLERIFYLEEYGKLLSEKINKKLSKIRHKCSNLEGAMSALGDASTEALLAAESNMKEALSNKYKLDEEYKAVEGRYQVAKEVWELIKELRQTEEIEQKHLLDKEQIDTKKVVYNKAAKANEILHLITAYNQTKIKLEEAAAKLISQQEALKALESDLFKAEADFKQKDSSLKSQIPVLVEKKTRLNNALSLQKEIEVIEKKLYIVREGYKKEKLEIQKHEAQINAYKEKLASINEQVQKSKNTIDSLKSSIEYKKSVQNAVSLKQDFEKVAKDKRQTETKYHEAYGNVSKLTKQLTDTELNSKLLWEACSQIKNTLELHINNKPIDKKQLAVNEQQYHSVRLTADKLILKDKDIEQLKQRLASIEQQIKEEDNKAMVLLEKLNSCKEQKNSIQEQLQQQTAVKERYGAYEIARTLTTGEACPVCGSKEHPSPAVEINDELLAGSLDNIKKLQTELTKTEDNLRVLEGQHIRLEAQNKALTESHTQLQADLQVKQKEHKQLQQELPEELKNVSAIELEAKLTELKAANNRIQKEIEAWELKQEELLQKLKLQEEKLNKHKIEESAIKAQLEVNSEGLKGLEGEREAADTLMASKAKEYSDYIKKLGIEDPSRELESLEQNDRTTEKLTKEIDELQANEQKIRLELEQSVENKNKCSNNLSDIEAEGRGLKAQAEEKQQQIKSVADGDIESELNSIEASIKQIEQEEKKAAQHFNNVQTAYNSTAATIKSLEDQQIIFKEKLESDSSSLSKALKEKGFADIGEAEASIIRQEEIAALENEIKQYEDTIKSLQIKKSISVDKLRGREIEENQWQQISYDFENLQKQKELSISQLEAAKTTYKSIKSSYEKWVELDKEMKQVGRKREILEQIQRLMKGNSFIEFISEERLRYIAGEASETLGQLTKYRYAIELDTDNGFMIRDNANGGVLRMVSTLSGGETFLTSLSLALALSSQLQLKGQSPLEFFFLDEGFGTLDNNLLDIVIDSLERLSSSKRVIGLISHVPELKSRLTRRLIVDPPTREGQGSRVRIEKA